MKKTCLAILSAILLVSSASAQNWYNTSPQQTNLDAEDEESGVESTYYCVDQSDDCGPQKDGQGYNSGDSISISTEGINYLRYFSEDKVGNDEDVSSRIFRLDLTDPETTTNYSGAWDNEPITVELSCDDPENPDASGCDKKYLCKGGSCSLNQGTSASFDNEGVTVLRYKSMDIAGNNEDVQDQDVRLDFTKPNVSVGEKTYNGGRNATSTCKDELSGCNESSLRLYVSLTSTPGLTCPNDPEEYDDGSTYEVDRPLWVCAAAKDKAGNWDYSDEAVVFGEEDGDPIVFNKDTLNVSLGGSSSVGFSVVNTGILKETYEVTIQEDTRAGVFSEVNGRPKTFTVQVDPKQSREFGLEVSGVREEFDSGEQIITARAEDAQGQNTDARGTDELEVNIVGSSGTNQTQGSGSNRNVPGITVPYVVVLLAAASAFYYRIL
jgi:opacity protein-like surface antigen